MANGVFALNFLLRKEGIMVVNTNDAWSTTGLDIDAVALAEIAADWSGAGSDPIVFDSFPTLERDGVAVCNVLDGSAINLAKVAAVIIKVWTDNDDATVGRVKVEVSGLWSADSVNVRYLNQIDEALIEFEEDGTTPDAAGYIKLTSIRDTGVHNLNVRVILAGFTTDVGSGS